MNLVLLFDTDFIADNQVKLIGRRYEHILAVHRATIGDQLQVGLLNGLMGIGTVKEITHQAIVLDIDLHRTPPPSLPVTLIIALPRPKMIKRILQTCSTMGVKKIIFLNSYRVEKSYWQTPLISEEQIKEQLIIGLEQAKDTQLPIVTLEKRFKPFVEDRLPAICENTLSLVAHPTSETQCPFNLQQAVTLVIGPEGGFIPYEIEKLIQVGCQSVTLGQRILRVETAVSALLARLFM